MNRGIKSFKKIQKVSTRKRFDFQGFNDFKDFKDFQISRISGIFNRFFHQDFKDFQDLWLFYLVLWLFYRRDFKKIAADASPPRPVGPANLGPVGPAHLPNVPSSLRTLFVA